MAHGPSVVLTKIVENHSWFFAGELDSRSEGSGSFWLLREIILFLHIDTVVVPYRSWYVTENPVFSDNGSALVLVRTREVNTKLAS